MRVRLASLGALAAAILVGACTITSSEGESPDASPGGTGGAGGDGGSGAVGGDGGTAGETGGTGGDIDGGPDAGDDPVVPTMAGGLSQPASCDDLEAKLKADAESRMNAYVDAQIGYIKAYYSSGGTGGSGGDGGSGGSGGADESASGWQQPSEAGRDYTDTNLQVAGVDEADIVKTDGTNIYLLHGEQFVIAQAWPSDQLHYVDAIAIEGKPVEMFVDAGQAVVYSVLDGTSVYSAAGVQPKPVFYPNDYGTDYLPYYLDGQTVLTKVTVLNLQGGAPQVTSQTYFEGGYLTARRFGDSVRTVIVGGAHGPLMEVQPSTYGSTEQEEIAAWEQVRKTNKQRIEAAALDAWMPYRFQRSGADVTAENTPCNEYLVPNEGSSEWGLVHLQTFDWSAPGSLHGVSIHARARTIYADTDSIYVATPVLDSRYYDYLYRDKTEPEGTIVPMDSTYIHKFDMPAGATVPSYVATGLVRGQVLNQFAMDERNGILRVATGGVEFRFVDDGYGEVFPEEHATNHVYTMSVNGDELTVQGRLMNIEEDEVLRSARFLEDKAYVVTFEQVDPLFVLDLADTASPKILGKVTIPGFSEYIHPIDPTHLLTIGKETEDHGSGPVVVGLALQMFDVSQPTTPTLMHKTVFGGDTGWVYSEAENNHRAFVYDPAKKVVLFPFVAYDYDQGLTVHTTLQVYSVDLQAGFGLLGAPSHDDWFDDTTLEWCLDGDMFGAGVRRGMFIDDRLYSISYGGIKVHTLDDLVTPEATLSLQSPTALGYSCAPPN